MKYKDSKKEIQIILHEQKKSSAKDNEHTLTEEKLEKGWARIADKELSDMKILPIDKASSEFNNMKDTYAVFYSGGWDSTALIIQHLLAGDTVLPVCLNFNSILHQRIASQATLYKLSQIFPHNLYRLRSITDIEGLSLDSYGLTQQPLTAFFAGLLGLNCKQIEFGYCLNDCAIAYKDEIQSLYKAASLFRDNGVSSIDQDTSDLDNPIAPLVFPLSKVTHSCNIAYVQSFINAYGELPIVTSNDTKVDGFYNKKENICKFVAHSFGKDSCGKEERFETMDITVPGELTNYVDQVFSSFKLKSKDKAISTAKVKATARKLHKLRRNKKKSSDDSSNDSGVQVSAKDLDEVKMAKKELKIQGGLPDGYIR